MFKFYLLKLACGLFILAWIMADIPAYSQINVTRIDGPEKIQGKKGIFYALPRTVIVVDLELTKTDEFAGPYSAFSRDLIGVEDVISESSTRYSLDNSSISAYVEADPQQLYYVRLDEKAPEAVLIEFTGNGLLAGAEFTGEEDQGPELWKMDEEEVLDAVSVLFPAYRVPGKKEMVDTIYRTVTFDTITYQEKIVKRSLVSKTDREQAVEASNIINDIEQDQHSLLVGYQETAYSYKAIKYMYDQLEKRRRGLLQLFTGTIRSTKLYARYKIVPEQEMSLSAYEIAGFTTESGLGEAGGKENIELIIKGIDLPDIFSGDAQTTTGNTGYYYRIPETCEVAVSYQGKTLTEETIIINQLGIVRNLPPTVTRVKFNPATGGIKKILLK